MQSSYPVMWVETYTSQTHTISMQVSWPCPSEEFTFLSSMYDLLLSLWTRQIISFNFLFISSLLAVSKYLKGEI